LNVSYIWSRARGDLNTVSSVFLAFEQPVIRPDVSGILPSDVPNRVVSWGVFHLPWSLTVSPVVDVHTGFPYSNVDVLQDYAGLPNGSRFPTFFSADAQVYRDFIYICLSWSTGAGTKFASACIQSISRTMAIFAKCTAT